MTKKYKYDLILLLILILNKMSEILKKTPINPKRKLSLDNEINNILKDNRIKNSERIKLNNIVYNYKEEKNEIKQDTLKKLLNFLEISYWWNNFEKFKKIMIPKIKNINTINQEKKLINWTLDNIIGNLEKKVEDSKKSNFKENIQRAKEYFVEENSVIDYNINEKWEKIEIKKSVSKYLKDLIWKDLMNTESWKSLFNFLFENAFKQQVDNPLYYNSHAFDHSITVEKNIRNFITNDKKIITNICDKYNINEKTAVLITRLAAICHDFWYPEQDKNSLDKVFHWFFSANLINSKEFKNIIEWIILNNKNKNAKINEIEKDFYETIFYHSSSKNEKEYQWKIETNNGSLLFDIDIDNENNNKTIEEINNLIQNYWLLDKKITIIWNEKFENFINQNKEKFIKWIEINFIKTHNSFKWSIIKNSAFWLEFTKPNLSNLPIQTLLRYADWIDISEKRLSKIQKSDTFQWIVHSFWIEIKDNPIVWIENIKWEWKDNTEKEIDEKNKLNEWYIKNKDKEIFLFTNNKIKINFNKDWKNIKLSDIISETDIKEKLLKQIIKIYKEEIINKILEINNVNNSIEKERFIKLWEKLNNISLRHTAWLEPIKELPTYKDWILIVKVNKETYDRLNENSVIEKSLNSNWIPIYVKIPVWDYQIWRTYESNSTIYLNEKYETIKIKIIDENWKEINNNYNPEYNSIWKLKSKDRWETFEWNLWNENNKWIFEIEYEWKKHWFINKEKLNSINILLTTTTWTNIKWKKILINNIEMFMLSAEEINKINNL